MAQRRMFSQRITNSGRFLQMSQSAQALYFHLGMRADDDGIVEAYPVMKLINSAEDDFRVLVAKGFIKPLNDDLVTYVLDWNEHNLIRADRKVNSIYKDLLMKIVPEAELLSPRPRADTKVLPRGNDTGRPVDNQRTAQVRLGKVRLGKKDIAEQAPPSPFNWEEYLKRMDDHKSRHVQVVALYFKEKKLKFDTLAKVQATIRRHLRAAKEVANFSNNEIVDACHVAKREYSNLWTIETVFKILTR